MKLDSAEVAIIGGGVSGLSSAYFLANAGVNVVVLEKGLIGEEASARNGGSMSPRADEPFAIPMATRARETWTTLYEELGYPTEFIQEGRLQVAMREEEMDLVRAMSINAPKYGVEARAVDPEEMRSLVPELTDKALGGMYFPNAGHANPQRAVQAYAWACQDRGGRIYQDTAVTGIDVSGGRVQGVQTTRGAVSADVVVSAAGPQSGLIGDMVGVHVPVAPGRVEIIATVPLEPRFGTYIAGNGLYGRQTLRGNLVFGGGPHEWIDVALLESPPKPNTPLVRNISRRLAELFPALEDTRVLRSWAGIVEQTPDCIPIIDKLNDPEGFVIVSASGNGFGLSPATGLAVKELIIDGKCAVDISAFRFDRLRHVPRDWRKTWSWQAGAYNT